MTIYTDGSCTNNGSLDAVCGSGIWVPDIPSASRAIRVPGDKHSNQRGEVAAVLVALQTTAPFVPILFKTDSMYVIDGLTAHLPRWEDIGWTGIANSDLLKATAFHLGRRSATTDFLWVKGHSGEEGNERADALAKEGANKDEADPLDLSIPPEFNLRGAKLSAMTQSMLYERVLAHKGPKTVRPAALAPLDMTRHAIKETNGVMLDDEALWRSIRCKDLRQPVRQLLYRAMHGSHRLGKFWQNVPGLVEREACAYCGDEESLEHIMTGCDNGPGKVVWDLLHDAWPQGRGAPPNITLGLILGCGAIQIKETNHETGVEQLRTNRSRLMRILISESAYLIWVLRCERTIQDRKHSGETIRRRWAMAIQRRLESDHAMACRTIRTESHVRKVQGTWDGLLLNEQTLPEDWAKRREVLVGIKLPRLRRPEPPR
ncbi:ribonuclease H-like protein [Punctularia strigosozonata HHB-11173 SS5]|uniref:ribonuclease H-like protein n=1 Tax=Punctularia strigosozonata (strain HHB-11173) TaxID=741275 RepID=UPI0004416B5A|nr:ribonuclease H-like protein [Punctularia strigosozonata HHB-11173 SS5]EIN07268.1 ribonuclease H-like protein [Punctularia strigosozonata HHB-11173 SS5]